jgi:hypothetical protein
VQFTFFAFDPSFLGGVTVATGDVTGDGILDIICGAGPGGLPAVSVFDGLTGQAITSFLAFPAEFTGGVYVASGDVNNDGYDDIICGAGPGAGPAVFIFDGRTFDAIQGFFAFPNGFNGGVRVASGDVNGDGTDDVIAGAGVGGGPAVSVFDGASTNVVQIFFAFDPSFTGGIFVATGDLDGDGFSDIIVGAGASATFPPIVSVFSGNGGTPMDSFFAFPPSFHGGVRVGAVDLNQNGRAEVVVGAGPSGGAVVELFDEDIHLFQAFFAFPPGITNGLFVA